MKPASTGLLALLASRQFFAVDLFQFALIDGTQLYYCSGDKDVAWNGISWSAGGTVGPYFDRSGSKAKCHWKTGVEVDTLVFDVLPGAATVSGLPLLVAVQQGVFDGAELTLYRAFMPTYGDTAQGTVIMFAGRVAEIDAGRSLATFNISSHLELLNQNVPRNVYQAGCANTLFDTGCGLNAAVYAVIGTVANTSVAYAITTTMIQPSGYFNLGKLQFTTGLNAGLWRTVKSYSKGAPGNISFSAPLPNVPAAGDNFRIFPGCDKRQNTCSGKFNNLAHFRGFPYIPENATAV